MPSFDILGGYFQGYDFELVCFRDTWKCINTCFFMFYIDAMNCVIITAVLSIVILEVV